MLCMMLLSSCLYNNMKLPELIITSPSAGWKYYDDVPVVLYSNYSDTFWRIESKAYEYNMTGNSLSIFLNAGLYVITAEKGGMKASVSIEVRASHDKEWSLQLLQNGSNRVKLKEGTSQSAVVSLDGSVGSISIEAFNIERRIIQESDELSIFRDVAIDLLPEKPAVIENTARARSLTAAEAGKFHVINTASQFGKPHEVNASCIYESSSFSILVPDNVIIEEDVMQQIVLPLETVVIPRLLSIWGEWDDINGDERISILFTPTINEEGVAVGFFNPNDFFQNDQDASSGSYNPYSNEMDIIYVAVPDSENQNYTVNSITATIAHELTHAIVFSRTTYASYKEKDDIIDFDLFLDEGLAHLSETLCGYGISGGNVRFIERYLTSPELYSFCDENDTAGSRGAVLLFLSHLFWQEGGVSFDSEGKITDKGGIAFLERLLHSERGSSWEYIGNALSTDTDSLYLDFIKTLMKVCSSARAESILMDPFSGEPLHLFPFVEYAGNKAIRGMKLNDSNDAFSLKKYSAVFLSPLQLESGKEILEIKTVNAKGTVYLSMFY